MFRIWLPPHERPSRLLNGAAKQQRHEAASTRGEEANPGVSSLRSAAALAVPPVSSAESICPRERLAV